MLRTCPWGRWHAGRADGAGSRVVSRRRYGLCVPRLTAGAQFLQRPSQGDGSPGPNVRLMNPKVSSWKATDSDAETSSAAFCLYSSVTDASYSSVNVNLLVQRWRSLALYLHILGKWRSRDKDSDIKGPVCTDVQRAHPRRPGISGCPGQHVYGVLANLELRGDMHGGRECVLIHLQYL